MRAALQKVVDDFNLDIKDPFTRLIAAAFSFQDERDELRADVTALKQFVAAADALNDNPSYKTMQAYDYADLLRQLRNADWLHRQAADAIEFLTAELAAANAAIKTAQDEAAWCLRQRDKDGERIATRVEACYLDYDPTKTIDAARAALKEGK